jgi:hypothetical protein
MVTKSKTGSLRYNSGKPEVSQLDPKFILAMADHMKKSEAKYGKYNWALGQEFHTPFDCAMRHILAFMAGEDMDKESGTNHIISAACNLMILWTSYQKKDEELDTRFKWK